MKKAYIYAIICLILTWFIAASLINNEVILPNINQTINSLLIIVKSSNFVFIVVDTVIRTFVAIGISFLIGLLLSILSFKNSKFKDFIHPIYLIFKTIPNITFIILGLIWLGRSGSVILIVSLVTAPIIYAELLSGFEQIDENLLLNTRTYSNNYYLKFKRIYLPLIYNDMITALRTTLSLGFKVTIMAELLSQIQTGIGRELYYAKINLETADIFGWTIIIIFISTIFDWILNLIEKCLIKH